jgi:hypothetical protein
MFETFQVWGFESFCVCSISWNMGNWPPRRLAIAAVQTMADVFFFALVFLGAPSLPVAEPGELGCERFSCERALDAN